MKIPNLLLNKVLLPKFNQNYVAKRACSCRTSEDNYVKNEIKGGQEESNKKGLVLGVYDNDGKYELTPNAKEVDSKSGGKVSQQLNLLSGRLKLGRAFVITDVLPEYDAVALASFGPSDAGYNKLEELDESRENVRWGVGAGVALLAARGLPALQVDGGPAPDAAAEAATLAAWKFQKYKAKEDRESEPSVEPYSGTRSASEQSVDEGADGAEDAKWHEGSVAGRGQNWARYLSDMPANNMTPIDLAQEAFDVLCPLGVKVTARDRTWIEAQNMQAFLAVARGSCEPPVLLECAYRGAASGPSVLLAAKGVTFDSGGLCLKRASSMQENRGSMAGAAVLLAAIKIIAQFKVPINLNAVIPLCENMVSGQCMKVGDVVRALNGVSIEIESTDMEGRLMLADALVYGQAAYHPALVIDVATLTHGVLLAMGGGACGAFSSSGAAWGALREAGARAGDRAWRLPLWRYYEHQLTNNPAVDLRNQGSGKATPCLGAAFLRRFVCCPWLHLDITGVGKLGHAPAPPYLSPRRMTGRPARTLAATLQALAAQGDLLQQESTTHVAQQL